MQCTWSDVGALAWICFCARVADVPISSPIRDRASANASDRLACPVITPGGWCAIAALLRASTLDFVIRPHGVHVESDGSACRFRPPDRRDPGVTACGVSSCRRRTALCKDGNSRALKPWPEPFIEAVSRSVHLGAANWPHIPEGRQRYRCAAEPVSDGDPGRRLRAGE